MQKRFVRAAVALAAAALIAAVLPIAAASAAPQHNPIGRHGGYVGSPRAPKKFATSNISGSPLLSYHGGPVMHQSTAYAIFWNPSGSGLSYPANYKTLIAQYFTDVAAASGRGDNPYGVNPQYTDTTGRANYNVSFGGSLDDTDAYPSTLNQCPTPGPNGETVCIDDGSLHHEISSEVASFTSAHTLPVDISHIYFVFFPPGATSCDDTSCAYTDYCAYHEFGTTSNELLYTNQPFPGDSSYTSPCYSPTQDANKANNNAADLAFTAVSHEHQEAMTDPNGTAWWSNTDGEENADECNFIFGPLHGTTPQFTNTINGHNYVIQEQYSNASAACEQHAGVQAAFTAPTGASPGTATSFTSSSTDAEGTLSTFSWSFGDGSPAATTQNPAHTFATPGSFTVRLTVTDNHGLTDYVEHSVSVTGTAPLTTDPSVSLHSSRNPSIVGKAVRFTATVSAISPATGVPSGTITFMNGTNVLGVVPLSSGVASFTTAKLSRGRHTITAVYSGDASFNPLTSAALTQVVKRRR